MSKEPINYQWRRDVVFTLLSGIFLGSLTMLNILGVTRFIDISSFLGADNNTFMIAVGVLPYPITFLCTDFISEIFGKKKANLVVWVGLILNIWVLFILWLGGALPPEPIYDAYGNISDQTQGKLFFEVRKLTFGTTIASMIAYLLAQFIDVHIFHYLKKISHGKKLWLRNNGSTLISQLVDTTAVILITHYYANGIPIDENREIFSQLMYFILTAYIFKLVMALLDTIPFYFGTQYLRKYLNLYE